MSKTKEEIKKILNNGITCICTNPSDAAITYYNVFGEPHPLYGNLKEEPRKRKIFSKAERFNIFNRDNFRCSYCGRSPSEDGVKLEVDHIIPVAKGGKNTEENLTTACYECNRGKNTKSLSAPLGKTKEVVAHE